MTEIIEFNADVRAWVDKLSDMTQSQIRDLLVTEHVQAVPADWTRCALSDFIAQKTGVRVGVQLRIDVVDVVDLTDADHDEVLVSQLPKMMGGASLHAFAKAFDALRYPELTHPEHRS